MARKTSEELHQIRELVYEKSLDQGCVFRRSDLVAWKVEPQLTRVFTGRRWWARLKHGIYCDSIILQSAETDDFARHRLHCAIAIASFELPTYAYGASAAVLHELALPDKSRSGPAEVIRPSFLETRDRSRALPGLPEGMRVRAYELDDRNFPTILGIPTLPRALAALSLAAELDEAWALAVLDSACWQRQEIHEELENKLETWPTIAGIGRLRKLVPKVRIGAQTPLESISRIRLMNLGIPEPLLQQAFNDRRGLIGYADMYWPEFGVVGEADGQAKYENRADLFAEKIREDRIRSLGLSVVRWTWEEIWKSPRSIADRIRNPSSRQQAS